MLREGIDRTSAIRRGHGRRETLLCRGYWQRRSGIGLLRQEPETGESGACNGVVRIEKYASSGSNDSRPALRRVGCPGESKPRCEVVPRCLPKRSSRGGHGQTAGVAYVPLKRKSISSICACWRWIYFPTHTKRQVDVRSCSPFILNERRSLMEDR